MHKHVHAPQWVQVSRIHDSLVPFLESADSFSHLWNQNRSEDTNSRVVRSAHVMEVLPDDDEMLRQKGAVAEMKADTHDPFR
jgi:hypothetical protein